MLPWVLRRGTFCRLPTKMWSEPVEHHGVSSLASNRRRKWKDQTDWNSWNLTGLKSRKNWKISVRFVIISSRIICVTLICVPQHICFLLWCWFVYIMTHLITSLFWIGHPECSGQTSDSSGDCWRIESVLLQDVSSYFRILISVNDMMIVRKTKGRAIITGIWQNSQQGMTERMQLKTVLWHIRVHQT